VWIVSNWPPAERHEHQNFGLQRYGAPLLDRHVGKPSETFVIERDFDHGHGILRAMVSTRAYHANRGAEK
jgi:hypothetical protein